MRLGGQITHTTEEREHKRESRTGVGACACVCVCVCEEGKRKINGWGTMNAVRHQQDKNKVMEREPKVQRE